MIIMCGNDTPCVRVNLSCYAFARFGMLERMPRVVSVEFSEIPFRKSEDRLDTCVWVPPTERAFMVHAVLSDSMAHCLLTVLLTHMFLVLGMRVFTPAAGQIHMVLANCLPPRLDGVQLFRKVANNSFVLAGLELFYPAPLARETFIQVWRKVGGPHPVLAAPRAPDDALIVGVPLRARRPRDLPADAAPRLVQGPIPVATGEMDHESASLSFCEEKKKKKKKNGRQNPHFSG